MRQDPYASSIFKQEQEPYEEEGIFPEAIYPEGEIPSGVNTNELCRACTNGVGDGMCNYHRSQLDRSQQRHRIIETKRQAWGR
jgi:hypothetical protein